MKRKVFYFILLSALILLSTTCGIPNIYVPTYGTSSSSDIQITRNSDTGEFSISLSDTIRNELSSNKPTLYFFYTISTSSQSSEMSSLINAFNNEYCAETSGTQINSTYYSYEYGSGDSKNTYYLDQLTYSSGDAFSYDMGNDDKTYTFSLTLDSSNNTLTLKDVLNDKVLNQNIKRKGGTSFSKAAGTDDITDYSVTNSYNVNIYLVISCQFDDYSNTYNTKIEKSYPILEFQLSE